jgi:ubiquinone/menaquinone biosynthesis C-methylase UbiE
VNADPIASWYRWLEYIGFGGALQRRRLAFLKDVARAKRALVLGEGDGRFLVQLVKQNRSASIDYVDISDRMLDLARSRAGSDRVTYHLADALTTRLPVSEYDLVCTNFFLDCLDTGQQSELVQRVSAACTPGARWLISEFLEPAWWAHVIVRSLYFFFRVTTGLQVANLVDHRPLLRQAGFEMIRCESARGGLLVSELWIRS